MSLNLELIRNLAASNADNAVESITLAVRELGKKYGWSIEEQMAVGDLVCTQRKIAVEAAMETAIVGLRDALGGKA